MQIHLSTLGCRLNEAELEQWATAFHAAGDRITAFPDQADVLILNTCAVTRQAVCKSRQRVQRLQRANPTAKVVVTGCYSSLEPPASLAELGIDLVVPNTQKDELVPLIRDTFSAPVMPEAATAPAEPALFTRNRHRAFIKIQDGCRYRCAFCIVTVARGVERSRQMQDIVAEVNNLSAKSIQEVVLTGVHVGGYGTDINTDLFSLVKTLLADTDIPRIRFASVEPWDLPDDFLTLFENSRVQPHMHLPLQSGSDAILRRMARRCKTADFAALASELRTHYPGFNITTDIICGFPGETEHHWQESLEFIKTMNFGHIHIFNYSKRDGTKAATFSDQVPPETRQARSRELHDIARIQRDTVMATEINRKVSVLWESGKAESGQLRHRGYTPNYLRVSTLSASDLANTVLTTRLTQVIDGELLGESVSSE